MCSSDCPGTLFLASQSANVIQHQSPIFVVNNHRPIDPVVIHEYELPSQFVSVSKVTVKAKRLGLGVPLASRLASGKHSLIVELPGTKQLGLLVVEN